MTPPDTPATPASPDPHEPAHPTELIELLATLDAEPAPASVRDAVLVGVRRAPHVPVAPMPPLDVFEHCVDALGQVLDEVLDDPPAAADPFDRRVDAYGWTVAELIHHLVAIERYTRSALGLEPDEGDPDRLDHLAVGRALRAELARRPTSDAIHTWRADALATIDALRAGRGPAPGSVVQLHQWPFGVDSLLIVRSFELWTHADDVRRATGRRLDAPPPAALRAMSTASVQSLPLLASVLAGRQQMPGVRVVLTGAGGGTHDIGDGPRATTVVADVVDYCRLVARRVDASVFAVEGDPTITEDLVAAAQAFAM